MASDPLKPNMGLLCKLASITQHADEMMSDKGHHFDQAALQALIDDSEVREWIKSMGPLAPVKR